VTPLPRRATSPLPLAVRRPVRHRPLQRRQLRGLPGPVRRGHLHRQGPAGRAGHARRARRPPARGQVLSHDLLEGALARCAAVTDVTLIEDAPFHADVAPRACTAGRAATGSCCRSCCSPGCRYGLPATGRAVNRWKMFDNLRRSLVAPMSLLLLLALAGRALSPWAALALVLAAFTAGPLMGALAGFLPSPRRRGQAPLLPPCAVDLARACCGGLWHLAQLLQQAMLAVDAIVRALYRLFSQSPPPAAVDHRRRRAGRGQTDFGARAAPHWKMPVVALLLLGALWRSARPPALALVLCCAVGGLAGVDLVGQPPACRAPGSDRCRPADQAYLTASRATPGATSSAASAPTTTTCRRTTCRPRRTTCWRTAPRPPTSACTCWRGLRAAVRLDRHAGPAVAAGGHAGHAGPAAAPPRPLPELVRHADRRAAAADVRVDGRQRQPERPPARRGQACRELAAAPVRWPRRTGGAQRLGSPADPAAGSVVAQRPRAAGAALGAGRPPRSQALGGARSAAAIAAAVGWPAPAAAMRLLRTIADTASVWPGSRLRLPVPPASATCCTSATGWPSSAGRRLLRPAGLGVAPDQPAGHRQGRRAGAPLAALGRPFFAVGARPGCARGRARCSST
jgi:hypothetical protein